MSTDALEAILPPPPPPVANYVPAIQTGNLVYTAGMLPLENGEVKYTGPVGSVMVSMEEGQDAARLCVLNALSAIREHLGGSLQRLNRIIKVTGFVHSAHGFTEQPFVLNGASNFLVEQLGERGRHVRSAVGVTELPKDASVEVELIVEVNPA